MGWNSRTFHREGIDEFGGSHGERDRSLLESALARPQQLFAYGEDTDLFDLAAAYLAGLTRNHPFVDGNKRIGFSSALLFLRLNGVWVPGPNAEATRLVYDLIAGTIDETDVAAWLRANAQPA